MNQTLTTAAGITAFIVGAGLIANFVANYAGYYKTRGGRSMYLKRHYIALGLLLALILVSALVERMKQ